jgi:hypothetical protein
MIMEKELEKGHAQICKFIWMRDDSKILANFWGVA